MAKLELDILRIINSEETPPPQEDPSGFLGALLKGRERLTITKPYKFKWEITTHPGEIIAVSEEVFGIVNPRDPKCVAKDWQEISRYCLRNCLVVSAYETFDSKWHIDWDKGTHAGEKEATWIACEIQDCIRNAVIVS